MHPILFTVPLVDLPVYSYGVMLGLGFISGWYLGMYFSGREGLPYKTVMWSYILAVVFSLVGARLAHVISNPNNMRMYGLFKVLFASRCEGLVAYGGYIGGTLAVVVYTRLQRIDFWSLADCTTPSLVLGLGLTRIGCFLAGCCHGEKTDLSWAVIFPAGSQASRVFGDPTAASPPVHPTQLYESAVGFLLVPLALYLVKRRKFTGQAFLILICCYAAARFFLEFIRADDDRGTVFGVLSTSQFIGLVLVPLAVGTYLVRRKRAPAPPEPLSREEVRQGLIEQGVILPKRDEAKSARPAYLDSAQPGPGKASAGEKAKGKKRGKKRSKNKGKG